MKSYQIITFGCAMNRSDSERLATALKSLGYFEAKKSLVPDLLIFNSCSVRQSAVDRIYGQMAKFPYFRTKNPRFKAALTGCVLSKDRQKLSQGFDHIFNIKNLDKLALILKNKPLPKINRSDIAYFKIKPSAKQKFSVLVPISFGCNRFCAYCAVPYTRGLEINRSFKEIIKEVKAAIKFGAKEIWLLGQTVSSWHDPQNKKLKFLDLLKAIEKLPGQFWVRFESSYILDFNDQLISFLAKAKKVNNYCNLPLQSGDNTVLRKMNRRYQVNQCLAILAKMKKRIPDFNFSTDIIVGFCGETKKQFENTCRVFQSIRPTMAFLAKYSPRPGTVAAKMFKDNVSIKEKVRRFECLNELLRQTAKENYQKEVNKTLLVLVDAWLAKQKQCLAKTRNFKIVRFPSKQNLIGKFVRVKIISSRDFELEGKIVR